MSISTPRINATTMCELECLAFPAPGVRLIPTCAIHRSQSAHTQHRRSVLAVGAAESRSGSRYTTCTLHPAALVHCRCGPGLLHRSRSL